MGAWGTAPWDNDITAMYSPSPGRRTSSGVMESFFRRYGTLMTRLKSISNSE